MEDAEFEHRLARLAGDLGETARLLNRHGEEHWAAWAARCRRGLEARDVAAFERILRAFGGMGSFNDLVIMAVNGHDVDPQQEPAVNDRLDRLRQQVWEDANALARAVRASS